MSNLKRFIAFTLSAIMLLSGSITSLADSNAAGGNAGQGDANVGDATSSGGNGTWNLITGTGFRFTICDASGKPVSKILGSSNSVSLDVVNEGVKLDVGEVWTACATDLKNLGMNSYTISDMSMSTFLTGINEPTHNFRWTDADKNPKGDEVREFILKGAKVVGSEGTGSGDLGGGIGDDYTRLKEHYMETFKKWSTNSRSADLQIQKSVLDDVTKQRQIFIGQMQTLRAGGDRMGSSVILDGWNSTMRTVFGQLQPSVKGDASIDSAIIEEYLIGTATAKADTNRLFTLLGGITAYADESKSTIDEIKNTIDETKNTIDDMAKRIDAILSADSVLMRIINLKLKDGSYVFQLEGAAKTVAEREAGGKQPIEVFIENNYVLLVEPTVQGCPQGWNSAKKKPGVSYKSLVYGTAHNWAQFGDTDSFRNSGAFSNTFGNHQSYLSRLLPNAMITLQEWVDVGNGGGYVLEKADKREQWTLPDMWVPFNQGYGCHVYTVMDFGVVALPYLDTGNPPPNTGDSFVLNRFFREKKKDGSYNYTSFDTHSYALTDTAQQVLINSVASGAALVEWGTSESEKFVPDTTKSPSEYSWETVKVKNSGTEKGVESKTLSLDKSTKIQTINILYELSSSTQVIKVYEDEDGNTEKVTPPTPVTGAEYTVPDEDEYVYVESKVTPNPPKTVTTWEDSEGSGGSSDKITITEDIKTIYIKYIKQDPTTKTLELYSNELSYTYDLRDLLANRVLLSVYDSVPASPGTEKECIEHEESCDCSGDTCNSDHTYTCSLRTHHLPDGFWTIKVDSDYDYNSRTTFIRDAQQIGDIGGTWGASTTGNTIRNQKATPNLRFMLYRDSSKDRVTLYPNKNSGLKATLQGLGITSESYTPAGSRVARVGAKDKSFRQTFETHFDYLEHDTSLRWLWPRAQCQKNNGGEYSTIPVVLPSDLNAAYSKSGNIREWYLLGTENSGNEKPRDTDDASWINKYRYNHDYSQTSAELSFYPYHKMLYRPFTEYRNEQVAQPVYVTSENLSKMQVYNTIQIGVYKKSRVNATLSSTQWSTHARSLKFLDSLRFDKRSVLPGGGILNLDMGSQGDTVLGVRLWQTALPDSQVQAVQAGFTTSVSKAKELATLYKQEVEATLAGYGLVQWGTDEVTTESEDVINSGEELHGSQSSSLVTGNGGKTSSDAKYYLKQDGEGSNRANLDVLESRIDKQTVYTVKADVDGNVWVEKDGALVGSKSKDLSGLLSNAEIKLLDDNTKVVTNLYNSLDRNLGEYGKYTRRQGEYYNEAFDGISVVLTDLSFDIGFSTGGSKRTMVLDPLLLSKAESKSELYNFEEGKVRTSAFVTTEESTSSTGGKGYLGTLGGDSNMGALSSGLGDVQSLVNSRVFFWSNFSVSDLN